MDHFIISDIYCTKPFFCPMQFCISSATYHKGEAGISPIYPIEEITDLTSKKIILLAECKQLKVRERKWNTKCHSFLGTAVYWWKISLFLALTYETHPVNFITAKALFELHIWNTIIVIEIGKLESCLTGSTSKWWFQTILEPVEPLSLCTFVAAAGFLFAVYEYIVKTKNKKAPNRHPANKKGAAL